MKKSAKILAFVLSLVLAVSMLTACGGKEAQSPKTLVGSWEYEGGGYTYTFNEDGTGTYNVAGTVMNFTYEDKGTSVAFTYEGNTVPTELEYSINGKKLNVKDSFGKDTIYIAK